MCSHAAASGSAQLFSYDSLQTLLTLCAQIDSLYTDDTTGEVRVCVCVCVSKSFGGNTNASAFKATTRTACTMIKRR